METQNYKNANQFKTGYTTELSPINVIVVNMSQQFTKQKKQCCRVGVTEATINLNFISLWYKHVV